MNDPKVVPTKIEPYMGAQEETPRTKEEVDERLDGLKSAVNEFFYKWLPPTMTLLEFEQFTCGVFAAVGEEWDKRRRRS